MVVKAFYTSRIVSNVVMLEEEGVEAVRLYIFDVLHPTKKAKIDS